MTESATGVSRRDRWVWRSLLALFVGAVLGYGVLDAYGLLPDRFSVKWHSQQRKKPRVPKEVRLYDPNLVLGVAIGDTRYRFNHEECFALITRPLFGVEHWVIPESVEYLGSTYTVTALDSFALLHAITVKSVRLPKSLLFFNNATEIASESIETIAVALPQGGEYARAREAFSIAEAREAMGLPIDEDAPLPPERIRRYP